MGPVGGLGVRCAARPVWTRGAGGTRSLTVTVSGAVPLLPAAVVIVVVRRIPAQPRLVLAFGTSVVLAELALSVRLVAGVSASLSIVMLGDVLAEVGVGRQAVRAAIDLGHG